MKHKIRILTSMLAVMFCCTAFSTTAFAGGGPEVEETVPEPTIEQGEPLSEESDIVTRDLLYDKATNKQFLTIQDRDGNIFYLVIDYDAPVDEEEEQYQTYFLNPVDTDDLAALAEKSEEKPIACTCKERCVAGKIDMNCPVCATDMTECAGKESEPIKKTEKQVEEPVETKEKAGMNPAILLLALALIGGGGVLAYFKLLKNKPKTGGNSDLDDYDYGEEEESEEDDASWESEEDTPDEENEDKED